MAECAEWDKTRLRRKILHRNAPPLNAVAIQKQRSAAGTLALQMPKHDSAIYCNENYRPLIATIILSTRPPLPPASRSTDGATPTPEVYDRPFNARDPHGANSWDTTRDLPLIWSTPGRAGAGFGPANTVMVDDTPRKMRFMDAGLVVVPEFKAACVLESLGLGAETGGDEEEDAGGAREAAALRQREVLPRVLEYLG